MTETPETDKKITVLKNGPYRVKGGVKLIRMTQVCSDKGEPLEWRYLEDITPESDSYLLCRCGKSSTMPFCDFTHVDDPYDGTETARTDRPSLRQFTYRGPGLTVKKDASLCMQSGFCVLVTTSVSELAYESKDPSKRDRAIKMVHDCPSGSLVCRLPDEEEDFEPSLPLQIAETIEITSLGPIRGPLWVMDELPIERADDVPFTPRNRVTLCRCGLSRLKPLCDGRHRYTQEAELRRKKLAEDS